MSDQQAHIDPGPFRPFAAASDGTRPPWFKRRGLIVLAGILIIIAAAVVTDLPQHPSLAAQVASDQASVKTINDDAAACAFAVGEAFTIRADQLANKLTASDKSKVPSLLEQDQIACSFTSQPINDLATIELPGSSAGKSMENIVSAVTLWTSSDANAAIVDIDELFDKPSATKPLSDLHYRERLLASDKAAALRALHQADVTLHAQLRNVTLPALP